MILRYSNRKDTFVTSELIAVTALYDIGRGRVGRPIEQYIGWLNATLRLPLRFTIFLDPNIDASLVTLKPGDRLVRTPLENFYPLRWESKVDAIRSRSQSQDLTFTLPRYALVVMSKYDMMQRVAREEGGACRMLWIDAGLSRFFRQDLAAGRLSSRRLERLGNAGFAAPATKWGLKQIKEGNANNLVGQSPRLITACDMYATGAGAIDAADKLYAMVEQRWLPNGKWDNEQVAMGCLLAEGWPGFQVTGVNSKFGSLVEDLFGVKLHRRGLPGRIQRWFDKVLGRQRA